MSTVEAVFRILRNRRYNREAPHLSSALKRRIETFIVAGQPIELVGFWGVGTKAYANEADEKTCEFLDELNKEIQAIYKPGLQFHFVFATLHGVHNGYDTNSIQSYVGEMKKVFSRYDFRWEMLEPLWKKYGISFEKIERRIREQPLGWWEGISQHEVIEHNAQRRQQRLPPREGAMRYYVMRDLEKEMWEKEFPEAIFHAFSDSRLRSVLPDMPTLYFYARRGWSDTPWFVE